MEYWHQFKVLVNYEYSHALNTNANSFPSSNQLFR